MNSNLCDGSGVEVSYIDVIHFLIQCSLKFENKNTFISFLILIMTCSILIWQLLLRSIYYIQRKLKGFIISCPYIRIIIWHMLLTELLPFINLKHHSLSCMLYILFVYILKCTYMMILRFTNLLILINFILLLLIFTLFPI